MRNTCFTRTILTATLLFLFPLPSPAQLFLEEIVIFAVDTVPKQSQVLAAGKSYDIMCSGTFTFWINAEGDSVGLIDAAFYRVIPPGEFGVPNVATTLTNGFLLNGQPIASRISPSGPSPTYEYRVPFIGQGAPAEVFIEDHPPFSIDRHADNSGAIRVRIFNVSPEILIDSTMIDFGEVELGARRDSVIRFENVGHGPLRINDLSIVGPDAGDFSLQAQSMYTLQPGESASVTVSFLPNSIFRKNAAVEMSCNDSDSPVITIPLTGVGVTTLEAGCRNDLHVPSQQVERIPVTLFSNREGSLTTSYRFELAYDRRLLLPVGIDIRGTLSESFTVDWNLVQPGVISITASGSTPLSGTGTLLYLRCFAAWSEPPVSPLTMQTLEFNSGNPRAVMVNGAVEVDSLCNQHLKSVHATATPQLRTNHPNPFNPQTRIRVDVPSAQNLRLMISDAAGRHVRTLADGLVAQGEQVFLFDASGLPSGVYHIRLLTAAGSQSRPMLLLR
ncbi:MAG: choice-of-anchor D domain-containing protein [Bacteroidetes bacterium]|nr:choice-of-anchor D domain-containing protein [Bacteroidota bacterium]